MSTSSNIEINKQINEYKEKLVEKGMYGDNFEILYLGGFIARKILLHEQDVILNMSTSSNIEINKQINEYKEKLVEKGMYGDNFEILYLGGFIARKILLHEQDVSYVHNNKIEHVPHEEFLKLIKLIELFYILYKKNFETYGLFDIDID
ncbi:hypothetical protein Glove_328g72 [Diversispora epigaea]|uniref:Uncharacterized protein n=1 Tax=Diversispora epigaea TaxID=1348612 RepID=A0A397HL83_9GLOM|nr:hypothetical protein Glove_328g72 [Diversispora epigaea]